MDDFDFIDYIVKYDRLYENGHTFTRDMFKQNNGKIVPITFSPNTPPVASNMIPYQCLGHAVLEDRDDGMVAKCKLSCCPKFLTRCLKKHHTYTLTFESSLMEVLGNMLIDGNVSRVLIIPSWDAVGFADGTSSGV